MKKVLLVEDNAESRYLARFLLQGSDFSITPCEDASSAIAALKVEHYDVVLLDLQLPDVDGLQVARHIRQNLKLDVPIFAVSAFAMPDDRRKATEAGCDAYIEKPIDPDRFADRVGELLAASVRA